MNLYIFLIVIISIVIMVLSIRHGFKVGFAHQVTAVVSLLAGIVVISLLTSVVDQFREQSLTGVIMGIVMLAVFGIVYKLVHVLLNSINFLARLPVAVWLDSGLGVVSGFLTGFGILYIIEFLLRNYFLS